MQLSIAKLEQARSKIGSDEFKRHWRKYIPYDFSFIIEIICLINFSQADRSFNDLTQYPVFPWIISDYTSRKLGKYPNSTKALY